MGKKNKTGAKGRLDKFYHLAKEQGYRSRAAFKLVQLNKKYDFLSHARGCIDLCAAPGSWLQVAVKYMPAGSAIIGVDLVPIRAIPNVVTMAEDITTPKCYARLQRELDGRAVDLVLCDGAPNVGAAWAQDAFTQSELTLHACRLATAFLNKGGTFITKVFRSADYNALHYVFNQLFDRVEATKPQASRNSSAEIFVVCLGYKNPKIDPRLLDPKFAFEDIDDSKKVDVFAKKAPVRNRSGYEEGNLIQHKKATLAEFFHSKAPIAMLADYNQLVWDDKEGRDLLAKSDARVSVDEIKALCEDLRVLNKKDFKTLLLWRRRLEDAQKVETAATAAQRTDASDGSNDDEDDDDAAEEQNEAKMFEEMKVIKDKAAARVKRDAKKLKRKRMKAKARQIMGGQTGVDIVEDMDMFHLKKLGGIGAVGSLPAEEATKVANEIADGGAVSDSESDSDAESIDAEINDLERDQDDPNWYTDKIEAEMEAAYEMYRVRKAKQTAEEQDDLDAPVSRPRTKKSSAKAEDNVLPPSKNISSAAALWFEQPIFSSVADSEEDEESFARAGKKKQHLDDDDVDDSSTDVAILSGQPTTSQKRKATEDPDDDDDYEDEPISFGGNSDEDDSETDSEEDVDEGYDSDEKATVSALAPLMIRRKTRESLLESGYNRYAHNDDQLALPKWFVEDEQKHSRPTLPITMEEARRMRDEQREINNRPIKKVAEARARKKRKVSRQAEKAKAKAAAIADADDVSIKAKNRAMEKVMKANKQKKPQAIYTATTKGGKAQVVGKVKGGGGRMVKVDKRMKSDKRGVAAAEKRKTGKRSKKRPRKR
eukprot:SAG31_NODE_142_length_22669_cov_18.630040_14_plen_824_part_00